MEPLTALAELLDSSDRPVYAIDRGSQIVYCNRAASQWLQLDVAHVVGRRVEYHSEHDQPPPDAGRSALAPLTGLCPPPRVLAGEETSATVSAVHRTGRLLHRRGRFIPLRVVEEGSAGDQNNLTRCRASILAVLEPHDLTPADLSQSIAAEPSADELHREIRRFRRGQSSRFAISALLGNSPAMRKVRTQVQVAADGRANVLVTGRPGSGRSRIAKSIHYTASGGSDSPFVHMDGNLFTEDLLRRSLDSLEKNCDARHLGTLLITEIHRLTTEQQLQVASACASGKRRVRLLGTFDEAETPGAVASDQCSGTPAMRTTLAETLFDLISTIVIHVPPLSTRLEDLPILAQYFVEAGNRASNKQIGGLAANALDRLSLYVWPGEIEELQSVILRAHDACRGLEITAADLPDVIHHAIHAASQKKRHTEKIDLDAFLARVERELIERAIHQAGGNKTEAAHLLGVTRPRLYRRLEQLGWEADRQFREKP